MSLHRAPRPLLIWFTQTLVILLAAVFLSFVVVAITALPQLSAQGIEPTSIVASLAVHVLLAMLLGVLSIGLARRRRWAWPASIVFGLGLMVFVLSPQIWPNAIAIAVPVGRPDFMVRSIPAEIAIFLALAFYPLRLFFSRKVRAFFGIVALSPDRNGGNGRII
jgi:hypothetical protein